jgi:hypothetical protein
MIRLWLRSEDHAWGIPQALQHGFNRVFYNEDIVGAIHGHQSPSAAEVFLGLLSVYFFRFWNRSFHLS